MKAGSERIVFQVDVQDRLELDEAVRRLGFRSRHNFFVDVIHGVLTALDNQDRNSVFVYVPIPRTMLERVMEKNESIQDFILRLLLSSL